MKGAQQVVVYSEPARVELRLGQLGLSIKVLLNALHAGLAAAALCSPLHPGNFAGLTLWAETIRWLRDTLIREGWRADNAYGLPTVVSGDSGMAIAVVRGGPGTGDPKANNVSTQYARGTVMIGRIQTNGVLPYDHLPPEYFADHQDAETIPTWLLMHRRDGDTMVCELSFPTKINKSGFVEGWGERVILTSIPLDPTKMRVLDDEPIKPDVKVRRRHRA